MDGGVSGSLWTRQRVASSVDRWRLASDLEPSHDPEFGWGSTLTAASIATETREKAHLECLWLPITLLAPMEAKVTSAFALRDDDPASFDQPAALTQASNTNTRDWRTHFSIDAIRRDARIAFRERLADCLEALQSAIREDDPAGAGVSPESIENLHAFLRRHSRLKRPSLTVTPAGDLLAEWKAGPDKDFSVHFLPTGMARFVVFAPDPAGGPKPVRIWGISSVVSLMRTVRPHGIHRWAMNEG